MTGFILRLTGSSVMKLGEMHTMTASHLIMRILILIIIICCLSAFVLMREGSDLLDFLICGVITLIMKRLSAPCGILSTIEPYPEAGLLACEIEMS